MDQTPTKGDILKGLLPKVLVSMNIFIEIRKKTSNDDTFFQIPIRKVTDTEKESFEGLQTEYKCKIALFQMKNQKKSWFRLISC